MKSEWISVKERMPKNGQHVLFCGYDFEDPDLFTYSGFYRESRGKGCWYTDSPGGFRHHVDCEYVTHWLPMPRIPSLRSMKEIQKEEEEHPHDQP